ncbi:MAG: hypothetical protein F6K61_02015 [Sphaerospermopsis sp. SIO1G1]|nr:hypothetical protein [Sphaerospermopsis sp. SIO1G1]
MGKFLNYELRKRSSPERSITNYELRITNYELQITNYVSEALPKGALRITKGDWRLGILI